MAPESFRIAWVPVSFNCTGFSLVIAIVPSPPTKGWMLISRLDEGLKVVTQIYRTWEHKQYERPVLRKYC